MKIRYFKDTDTLYLEFNKNTVSKTQEFNENTYMDYDQKNNLVSVTIEHARDNVDLEKFELKGLLLG